MKARLFPVVTITLFVLVFSAWAVAGTAPGKPRLVLQITIDQMRGDFPMRYKDRLGEGGFRYLMEKGTHYVKRSLSTCRYRDAHRSCSAVYGYLPCAQRHCRRQLV